MVVLRQTEATISSLNIANESIKMAKRDKELSLLPGSNLMIILQVKLEEWLKGLNQMIKILKSENKEEIETLRNLAPKTPKGMVKAFLYERMSPWQREIWLTGAQHYYNNTAALREIKSLDHTEIYLSSCQDAKWAITELLSYLNDEIPDVFLEKPASMNDGAFFDYLPND